MKTWRIRLITEKGKIQICYVSAKNRVCAREVISSLLTKCSIAGITEVMSTFYQSEMLETKSING